MQKLPCKAAGSFWKQVLRKSCFAKLIRKILYQRGCRAQVAWQSLLRQRCGILCVMHGSSRTLCEDVVYDVARTLCMRKACIPLPERGSSCMTQRAVSASLAKHRRARVVVQSSSPSFCVGLSCKSCSAKLLRKFSRRAVAQKL